MEGDIGLMVIVSMPATVGYILGTKLYMTAMNRFTMECSSIGFSMGVLTFTVWTYWYMKEGLNMKNTVTLVLSVVIVLMQVFWKTK
jgi:hypothetical protein